MAFRRITAQPKCVSWIHSKEHGTQNWNIETQRAQSGFLTMSAGDNLLGAGNQHEEDPADSWGMLKTIDVLGGRSTTDSNAHQRTLRHGNGGGERHQHIYTWQKRWTICNQLIKAHGETISGKTLINLVLNLGLPRSYEMAIQGVTYLANTSFETVAVS